MYDELKTPSFGSVAGIVIGATLVCLMFLGCNKMLHDARRNDAIVMKEGNTSRMILSPENTEMAAAMKEAQGGMGEFIRVVQHPKPGEEDFAIYTAVAGRRMHSIEYVWLRDVVYADNTFIGNIQTDREHRINGKTYVNGDIMSVPPRRVKDWRYLDHGEERGNYTSKALTKIRQTLGKLK
jgi:uncharacterized protein YegJ (DUF2314 family)